MAHEGALTPGGLEIVVGSQSAYVAVTPSPASALSGPLPTATSATSLATSSGLAPGCTFACTSDWDWGVEAGWDWGVEAGWDWGVEAGWAWGVEAGWAWGVEAGCDWDGMEGGGWVAAGPAAGLVVVHAVTLRIPARPSAAIAATLFERAVHLRAARPAVSGWRVSCAWPVTPVLASIVCSLSEGGGDVFRRALTGCRFRCLARQRPNCPFRSGPAGWVKMPIVIRPAAGQYAVQVAVICSGPGDSPR